MVMGHYICGNESLAEDIILISVLRHLFFGDGIFRIGRTDVVDGWTAAGQIKAGGDHE